MRAVKSLSLSTPSSAHPFQRCNGRDDWIRTSDLTHPKRARYQAAPRPDMDKLDLQRSDWFYSTRTGQSQTAVTLKGARPAVGREQKEQRTRILQIQRIMTD